VWGYGKKLAHLTWSGQDAGGPGTEQLVMTVERPAGVRLMTLSMCPDRLVDGAELTSLETAEMLPTLSHRVLPGLVDELIAVDVRPRSYRGADGRLEIWRGRGAVELHGTAADPWHAFRPTRVLDAFSACTDFVLPEGRVVPRATTTSTTEEC
jgi:hypothetical protein